MTLAGTSLQVLTAAAVVIILFIVGYFIFNREARRAYLQETALRSRQDIFTGVKDMALVKDETYNTINKNSPLFKDLKPSVNQRGGIEFTYNFWLYKDATFQTPPEESSGASVPTDSGLNSGDVVLFLRGVNRAVKYKNVCGKDKYDVMVKCPLVKLENYGDSLTVEFNSKQSPDVVNENARNTCKNTSTDWNTMNSHKVSLRGLGANIDLDRKWFMVTICIQDTYPDDPLPMRNRVRVRIYINGVLELDQYVNSKLDETSTDASILKPNDGNLYVMPQIDIPGTTPAQKTTRPANNNLHKIMMADMAYFNYIIEQDNIVSNYQNGFNKFYAVGPTGADPTGDVFNSMSYTDGKTKKLFST